MNGILQSKNKAKPKMLWPRSYNQRVVSLICIGMSPLQLIDELGYLEHAMNSEFKTYSDMYV